MRLYNLQTFPKHDFLLSLKNKQKYITTANTRSYKKFKNLNGIFFLEIYFATLYFALRIVFDQFVITKKNHVIGRTNLGNFSFFLFLVIIPN